MAKEFGTGKNFTFLRINAKGELCVNSKEPKEGYVKVDLQDNKFTYQKVFKSTDYGKIVFLGIKDKTFPTGTVKYVELSIASEDDPTNVDVLQLPLKNAKNGISDEVKKLIAVLPSLDYSKTMIVSSNREKNQRGYVDKVLFFRYKTENAEEKDPTIKFSLKFGEKGNVPMFEVSEDPLSPGDKTFDYKKQDAFLSQVLMYELKRYEAFRAGDVYQSEYFDAEPSVATSAPTENKQSVAPTEPAKPSQISNVSTNNSNPFANAMGDDDDTPF